MLSLPLLAGTYTGRKAPPVPADSTDRPRWVVPDLDRVPKTPEGALIRYGRELIAHTSDYLGPDGKVRRLSNGMNCQNCHLDAGTRFLGNNYSAVYSTYPKYRARSGTEETIVKRISDCFERSLNGRAPDSTSREMKAMIAYMKWLGRNVPKGATPKGAGLQKPAYLDRPADPLKGGTIYAAKCTVCHGKNGEGIRAGKTYVYPPMWGPDSYNDAAGLYRLSNFAGFVKNNMPFGATSDTPQLTDDEAWDVAAFVNSRPRPHKDQSGDWKEIRQKPVDFPFGPYADPFSEEQHKFGPYRPILESLKKP